MSAFLFWVVRRGHRRSVKQFSSQGLLRYDGRTLPWTELNRVVTQVRLKYGTGAKYLWRAEIHFRNGESAWLVPNKIKNREQVYAFARSLPCEHVEVVVGTKSPPLAEVRCASSTATTPVVVLA
jgi:hypothetical protein